LDLQLENSLIYSQAEKPLLLENQLLLSSLIESVKNEWDEIEVTLDQDAKIKGDRRSLMSVFRNLFQNAMMHGKSQKISIRTQAMGNGQILIQVSDNGPGYSGDLNKLGLDPLPQKEGDGSGIGLYLCRFLMLKQNGNLKFINEPGLGLTAQMMILGEIHR
jgi:signal transduction histidine kinase